jgi:hypothetical protein
LVLVLVLLGCEEDEREKPCNRGGEDEEYVDDFLFHGCVGVQLA